MEPPLISQNLVRAELDRLMDSPALCRAPSHMRLLRYLVTRRMAADAAALRETAIAVEVFRRDPSTYDPQTDPIVRVTARRLRKRLDAHYAAQGGMPAVRIVLPKGRYAPEFITPSGGAPAPLGILVLATRNLTGDSGCDARCEAFADRLRDHLAHAGIAHVHGRDAIPADASARPLPALANDLGVAWLLQSTLAREQERELRLSVRLVHAADNTLRWVETAVAQAHALPSLLERMLDVVLLRTLDTVPLPAGVAARTTMTARALPRTQRVALDQVQLMLAQRNLRGADDAVAIARAVAEDHPEDADAWATLAAACLSRYTFQDREGEVWLGAVHASIERALALAPEHPVALRTKGILTGKRDYDAAAAEDLFRRALRSMPHYTSARLNLAELLAVQGKAAETLAEINLARVYDPLSPSVLLARAICLDLLRSFDASGEAWGLCAATGESSLWVLTGVGTHRTLVGDLPGAAAAFAEAARRHPDSPMPPMGEAYLFALRGDAAAARAAEAACVARFPHVSAESRAVLAACLGDRDRLLALLTQARAAREMGLVLSAIHPALDAYARDAEVLRLLPFGCYVGLR